MNKNVKIIIGILSVIVVISMIIIGFNIHNNLSNDSNVIRFKFDSEISETEYLNYVLESPSKSFYDVNKLLSKSLLKEIENFDEMFYIDENGNFVADYSILSKEHIKITLSNIKETIIDFFVLPSPGTQREAILLAESGESYYIFLDEENENHKVQQLFFNNNDELKYVYKSLNNDMYCLTKNNKLYKLSSLLSSEKFLEIDKTYKFIDLNNVLGPGYYTNIIHDFMGNTYYYEANDSEKIYVKFVDTKGESIKVKSTIFGKNICYFVDINNEIYSIEHDLNNQYFTSTSKINKHNKKIVREITSDKGNVKIIYNDGTIENIDGYIYENPYYK